MEFYGKDSAGLPTHLLSGSEDRNVCIWKVGNWAHLQVSFGGRTWRAGILRDDALLRKPRTRRWITGCP